MLCANFVGVNSSTNIFGLWKYLDVPRQVHCVSTVLCPINSQSECVWPLSRFFRLKRGFWGFRGFSRPSSPTFSSFSYGYMVIFVTFTSNYLPFWYETCFHSLDVDSQDKKCQKKTMYRCEKPSENRNAPFCVNKLNKQQNKLVFQINSTQLNINLVYLPRNDREISIPLSKYTN